MARLARREGLAGQIVTLKIRFQGFETYTRQQRLDHPSQDDRTLLATAWSLYEATDLPRKPVRLIGLGISDLGPPQPVQQDLFDGGPNRTLDSARDRSLNATLDHINARFGPGALRRGETPVPGAVQGTVRTAVEEILLHWLRGAQVGDPQTDRPRRLAWQVGGLVEGPGGGKVRSSWLGGGVPGCRSRIPGSGSSA